MEERALIDERWRFVVGLLPRDLEESAVRSLVIRRRRAIGSAGELVRLALAYGLCDLSLRQVAAWAQIAGVGRLSDVAVLKRLRAAGEWLGEVVLACLRERGVSSPWEGSRLVIADATVVSKPGSQGTDHRVHLGLDLGRGRICSFAVTGVEGGETLRRVPVEGGEVVLADRCYAHGLGVASVLDRGGHVVVRLNAHTLPLLTREGEPLEVPAKLEGLGEGEIGDWPVAFRSRGVLYPMRLVAIRKTSAAAERERRRLRREYTKKGKRISARAMAAAAYVAVVTDLDASTIAAAQVLELYRLRWQVEIAFKRLKSLLHLDRLRAKDPALARCYLYAKLLAAILLDDLCERLPAFSPWGYPLLPETRQPLAIAAPLD